MKKIISIFAVLLMVMTFTVPAMAEQEYFGDYGVSINVPDGWYYDELMAEYSSMNNVVCLYNGDGPEVNVWYLYDGSFSYGSFYDEEEAQNYYSDNGLYAFEEFLSQKGFGEYTLAEPEFYAGDYQNFLKIKAECDGEKYYYYLTCSDDRTMQILEMYPAGHKIHPDRFAKDFYDCGYSQEVEEGFFGDIFGDSDIVDMALPAVAILAALVSVIKSLLGKEKGEKKSAVPVREESVRVVKRIKKAEEHHEKDTQNGVKQTAYTGCTYEDSLRTLYKSGLLTRQQLNEMLEKHRRD